MKDQQIWDAIEKEQVRQDEHIELIASENFVSEEILEVTGSILTNKYAEGYSGNRYYGGCQYVDIVEDLANERLRKLFNADYSNVQPHSGSQANQAVYLSVLKPGDKVLGMDLDAGGHLTHGHKLNFSGSTYDFVSYGVDPSTEALDMDEVERIAIKEQPKLIVAGASSYPRIIDFKRFRAIADKVDAYLMVDMAHIAGLVATGLHPSPVPYADFVTSTTHKTLRGPRGGIILCKKEHADKINRAVFPGSQGGPLMHVIAGKAVCFKEALTDDFKLYQKQVIKNAKALAESLEEEGFRIVSGGTDNHLVLVDVMHTVNLTGLAAEQKLGKVNITCNKNMLPFDKERPIDTSGIRVGTPAMTTRGFKEEEFKEVGKLIAMTLKSNDASVHEEVKTRVLELTKKFPLKV